jgi:hypothetical protein
MTSTRFYALSPKVAVVESELCEVSLANDRASAVAGHQGSVLLGKATS